MSTAVTFAWWSISGIVALLGLLIAARALFRDRSRGRPRCPRCWYERTGSPEGPCPECGHVVKRERKLYKTRRRWRYAVLGILLLLLGLGGVWGQQVRANGWIEATPTAAYIVALPHLGESIAYKELLARVNSGELRQWEYRLLVHRAIGGLDAGNDAKLLCRMSDLLARIEFGGRYSSIARPWASWALTSEVDGPGAIDGLVQLLDHPDRDVRLTSIMALSRFTDPALGALPALLGQFASNDDEVQARASQALVLLTSQTNHMLHPFEAVRPQSTERDFLRSAAGCGTDLACTVAVFTFGLDDESARVRAFSVFGLTLIDGDNEATRDAVLAMVADPDEKVRILAVQSVAVFPLDDRGRAILYDALDEPGLQYVALRVVDSLGPGATEFIDTVERLLKSTSGNATQAAVTLVRIGGDPKVAFAGLVDNLDECTGHCVLQMLGALGELGVADPRARRFAEARIDDEDPLMQAAAVYALARMDDKDTVATSRVMDFLQTSSRLATQYFVGFQESLARDGSLSADMLTELLMHEDPRTRYYAAQILGEMGVGGAQALDTLELARVDANPRVAEQADYAVKRIEWALAHQDDE
ncbi:MAG: hypothetical protein HKN62_00580 [Phycisphaerales bacterium]|nr:hypothetical protein [Phycisphaerales bacterium]